MTLSYHLSSYPKKALLCPPSTQSSLSTGGFSPSLKDVLRVAEPLVGPQGHRPSPSRSQFSHQVAMQLHGGLLAVGLARAPARPELPAAPSGNTCINCFLTWGLLGKGPALGGSGPSQEGSGSAGPWGFPQGWGTEQEPKDQKGGWAGTIIDSQEKGPQ